MNLEQMKLQVKELVEAKGFGWDATEKLLWAFCELGEVTDMHKKGWEKWYISNKDNLRLEKFKSEWGFKQKQAEEVIDVLFYLLNYALIEFPDIDLDNKFFEKLTTNFNRPYKYGVKDGLKG